MCEVTVPGGHQNHKGKKVPLYVEENELNKPHNAKFLSCFFKDMKEQEGRKHRYVTTNTKMVFYIHNIFA